VVAVPSAGCNIVVGVAMMIIRRVMTVTETTGLVLAIQYWTVLHDCHLLLNILC
jgi:hypothetical protein